LARVLIDTQDRKSAQGAAQDRDQTGIRSNRPSAASSSVVYDGSSVAIQSGNRIVR
jgi:hypothetical protein